MKGGDLSLAYLHLGIAASAKEVSLSLAVTRGSYGISVTNSSGRGPVVETTFTLTVTHP